MDALMDWLVSTPINGLVLNYAWSWPTLESLHFLALCMLMGSLLIMDLRLIGFNRIIPLQAVHSLMPVAIVLVRGQLDHGPRVPVRRPVHVLRELGVLGQDELDRARRPQFPRVFHEGRAEDPQARPQRADAHVRQSRRRDVARILVRRAVLRPIAAVLGNRRRLTPRRGGAARRPDCEAQHAGSGRLARTLAVPCGTPTDEPECRRRRSCSCCSRAAQPRARRRLCRSLSPSPSSPRRRTARSARRARRAAHSRHRGAAARRDRRRARCRAHRRTRPSPTRSSPRCRRDSIASTRFTTADAAALERAARAAP